MLVSLSLLSKDEREEEERDKGGVTILSQFLFLSCYDWKQAMYVFVGFSSLNYMSEKSAVCDE